MHFSQYLQALNQDAPLQWRGKFLDYKALKKKIKSLGPESAADCKDCDKSTKPGCDHSKDAKFLAFLYHEVQRVDSEFTRATRQVFKQAQDGQRQGCWSCFRPSHAAQLDADKLVAQAEWCRRFAQINSVALRKIVKKHDKVCGCRSGSEFLQQLWSGSKRSHGAFLHSPLMEELKSLETMLLAERAGRHVKLGAAPASDSSRTISVELSDASGVSERVDLPMLPSLEKNTQVAQHYEAGEARSPDSSRHGGTDDASSNAGPALPDAALPACTPPEGAPKEVAEAIQANEAAMREVLQLRKISLASSGVDNNEGEVDPDYVCPICLEAMYQPLGLECGHKFCADCAFSSVGKGNALGTVRAILDHVDPSAACPECRTRGVFVNAMELKNTEKLIRQRYPKAWAERAEDAKAKEKRLRALLQEQRMRARASFSARVPF